MNSSVKILLLFSFFLLVTVESNAGCVEHKGNFYDNQGRKLTGEKLRRVRAYYPLIHAIETSDMAAFKSALKNGVDVNARDCDSGTTALILTIIENDPEMTRNLIEHKANINLHNDSGWTALMMAVGGYVVGTGRVDIVKELIAAGRDVKAQFGGNGPTSLSFALRYSNKEAQEVVKILKAHGATR